MNNKYKTIRISEEAYQTLRFLAFKNNETIVSVTNRLLEGKANMTIVEKLLAIKEKK